MQFKIQWSDCEINTRDYVGFAQDKDGTLWYFGEGGEQFTLSELGIFSESAEVVENSKPFTIFDGFVTMSN